MSTLTAPLTSFTNAAILKTIGHDRLNKFLLEFVDDLSAANLSLPDHNPCCGDEYFNALAALIASPALPQRPRLALQFLELLVSPEHIDRLNAEINRHLPCVSFPFDGPPVDRALELWFARPQSMVALAAEIDQSVAPIRDNSSNSCLPRPSQTEAGPSVPIQNLESKIQDPDGSAAGDSLFGPIGE